METQHINLEVPAHLMSYINVMTQNNKTTPSISILELLQAAIEEKLEDEDLARSAEERMAEEGHLPRISHQDAWK
jgi:hypothetical protein